MNKNVLIILTLALIVFLVIIFSGGNTRDIVPDGQNVTIVDGKQIIEITAKGGYVPRASSATARIPTILRFNTRGTFDCSSSVRIPSMDISKILPNSGVTDIDLGNPKVGVLSGTVCITLK